MAAQVQPPTFTGITIRTIDEANRLFHVVRLGKANLFTRRLTVEERRAIYTGCVFVWEERNPTLEATGGFLYYNEKLPEIADPVAAAALLPNRLIKQTYSVWVGTPEGKRKWHLVAYYTDDTQERLRPSDEVIAHILGGQPPQIPVDAFEPARQPKGGKNRQEEPDEADAPPAPIASSSSTSSSSSSARSNTRDEPRNSKTPPPMTLEDKLRLAVVDMENLTLPEIPNIPPRDPLYVLQNCVAVCPDIYQAQSTALMGAGADAASKDLAPLVYMRKTPYTPRHPLDNDALRFCDANSRWLSA
ncbi:hypothetical protein EIP91_011875 [Steccherinum ochraceum]|uniref:Uncharacterized protein n=1 Tax=Steccherinum ochraceum TaxID=92696 RepID=A0A4V6N778_9APHY|nr:hypothetical protein EIP91_011875 [Steccherinum ochraceum]